MDTKFTGNIEIDNEILQIILEDKHFYTGTKRKMMLKNGTGHYPKKGEISATFGYTRRGQLYPSNECREESPYYGWYYTKTYSENKDLIPIFQEYSDLHLPTNFFWTQVQINRCFETPPHRDPANQGASVIVAFGDYTGGKLCINKNGKVYYKDIKNKPLKFNGAKWTHWTSPYSGTRWSLVFYSHHQKNELKKLIKKKQEYNNNVLQTNINNKE
jgi:hypothetical protein